MHSNTLESLSLPKILTHHTLLSGRAWGNSPGASSLITSLTGVRNESIYSAASSLTLPKNDSQYNSPMVELLNHLYPLFWTHLNSSHEKITGLHSEENFAQVFSILESYELIIPLFKILSDKLTNASIHFEAVTSVLSLPEIQTLLISLLRSKAQLFLQITEFNNYLQEKESSGQFSDPKLFILLYKTKQALEVEWNKLSQSTPFDRFELILPKIGEVDRSRHLGFLRRMNKLLASIADYDNQLVELTILAVKQKYSGKIRTTSTRSTALG